MAIGGGAWWLEKGIFRKDDPGNIRPFVLTLVPGKVEEQIFLGAVSLGLRCGTLWRDCWGLSGFHTTVLCCSSTRASVTLSMAVWLWGWWPRTWRSVCCFPWSSWWGGRSPGGENRCCGSTVECTAGVSKRGLGFVPMALSLRFTWKRWGSPDQFQASETSVKVYSKKE